MLVLPVVILIEVTVIMVMAVVKDLVAQRNAWTSKHCRRVIILCRHAWAAVCWLDPGHSGRLLLLLLLLPLWQLRLGLQGLLRGGRGE